LARHGSSLLYHHCMGPHLANFLYGLAVETKKRPNDNLNRFACIFALISVLVYMILPIQLAAI